MRQHGHTHVTGRQLEERSLTVPCTMVWSRFSVLVALVVM
jgi:hypothetical protein